MIDIISFLVGIGTGLVIAMIFYRLRIIGFKKRVSNLEDDINELKRRIKELEWVISDIKNNQRKERKIGDPTGPTGWEKNPDGVYTTLQKMLDAGM